MHSPHTSKPPQTYLTMFLSSYLNTSPHIYMRMRCEVAQIQVLRLNP